MFMAFSNKSFSKYCVEPNNRFHYALLSASVVCVTSMYPSVSLAQSQFSLKAVAVIQSCTDAEISGFATLKEVASSEGVKEVEVYMQVNGLSDSKRAVHIHEVAACAPCGGAGGHYDPGSFGMSNPDANHPFHSGDLINIKSQGGKGVMTTRTSRVTLSDGTLSVFDGDGSSFIVHDNADSYCQGSEVAVAGCAGGSRAACGMITTVDTIDDFELSVSTRSNRGNANELSNAELTGRAYVFLSPTFPSTPIESVDFFVNGNVAKTETDAPFDLRGTRSGESISFNTRSLSDGTHTMSAVINLASGGQTFVSSEFTVDNDSQSFVNGSENN